MIIIIKIYDYNINKSHFNLFTQYIFQIIIINPFTKKLINRITIFTYIYPH